MIQRRSALIESKMWRDVVIGALLMIFAILVPFFVGSKYLLSQFVLFFIWATVVSQWNIVMGVAGVFSLAQLALFAFGGYVAAMLGKFFGLSLWFGVALGGVATVGFSMLIGIACLRLRGVYVALLTFAIAQVMFQLINTDITCFLGQGQTCETFTGGPRGLTGFEDFGFREVLGRKFMIGDYYLSFGALVLATAISIAVIRGPLGFAFRALRDNESVAGCRGIDRYKIQLFVFSVSAFVTGAVGVIYAGHFKVIGPSILNISLLSFLVSMMVVGGLGRVWGPILGAALLMFADEQLKDYEEYRNIGLGATIVVFMVLLPQGLVGAIEQAWAKVERHLRSRLLGRGRNPSVAAQD